MYTHSHSISSLGLDKRKKTLEGDRIGQLDFLKAIFIILMIVFHLVYIEELYPYAKKIVYTFHMPIFLIISGYLTNINKNAKPFLLNIFWLFVPYVFMETGYVIMSSILPVRDKIDILSFSVLMDKIFLSPMGPYWYFHTLIICSIIYYFTFTILSNLNKIPRFIILGSLLFILSYFLHSLSINNVIYFLIGIAIRQSKLDFLFIFQSSLWALVPMVILCFFSESLDKGTLTGFLITYCAISISLYLYSLLSEKIRRFFCFIGQNTLIILLFSPIFTFLSRLYLPLFSFDKFGVTFTFITILVAITGCLTIGYFLDKMHISILLFGKPQILSHLSKASNTKASE